MIFNIKNLWPLHLQLHYRSTCTLSCLQHPFSDSVAHSLIWRLLREGNAVPKNPPTSKHHYAQPIADGNLRALTQIPSVIKQNSSVAGLPIRRFPL